MTYGNQVPTWYRICLLVGTPKTKSSSSRVRCLESTLAGGLIKGFGEKNVLGFGNNKKYKEESKHVEAGVESESYEIRFRLAVCRYRRDLIPMRDKKTYHPSVQKTRAMKEMSN